VLKGNNKIFKILYNINVLGWNNALWASNEWCGFNLRNSVYQITKSKKYKFYFKILIKKGNLKNGSSLSSYRGDHLISPNSNYIAIMQTNGAFKI